MGAFASLMPPVAAGWGRVEVLRQIAGAILARGEGSPVAILVDDAHLLDDSSGALTHLLAGGDERLFLLATVRSGEPAPDSVVALWKDGLVERLDLAPLDAGGVAELLDLTLGAPVDGAAAHLLWQRTQGNALFLRELVLASLASDVLRSEDGVWRLTGSLPISPRLQEIVEARLGDLTDAVRRSLGVVSLGEPLGADVLQEIDPETDLELLEQHGLIRMEASGRRLDVRLAHPLYGEVVRARLSPLRVRTVIRALAEALQRTGARRREDTLRVATLSLDGAGLRDRRPCCARPPSPVSASTSRSPSAWPRPPSRPAPGSTPGCCSAS